MILSLVPASQLICLYALQFTILPLLTRLYILPVIEYFISNTILITLPERGSSYVP